MSKIGRPNKTTNYVNERQEILERLYEIVGVTDTNKFIYLYDLEHNKNKQELILGLESDVKKYFKCGRWSYFTKQQKKRP